jgi:hypothetical protein
MLGWTTSNAALRVNRDVTVTASYSAGTGFVSVTNTINLLVHDNSVTLVLPPFIAVNDNDTDGNGTNDCEQVQPPANDPQIVVGFVMYNKTCSCSHLTHPLVTVTCEWGSWFIREWSLGGQTNQYPVRQEYGTSTVAFYVEGMHASYDTNNVRFSVKVEDRDSPGGVISNTASTTIVKVDLDADTDRNGVIEEDDENDEAASTLTRGALVTPPLRALTTGSNDIAGMATIKITAQPAVAFSGLTLKLKKTFEATGSKLHLLQMNGEKLPDRQSGQSINFADWPQNVITLAVMSQYARPLAVGETPIRFDLELLAVDSNNHVICSDLLRLKVAPSIIPPECNASQNIYTRLSSLTCIPGVTFLTNDTPYVWAQDMVKFVKYQVSDGSTKDVFVDLDHPGKGNFPDKLREEEHWNGGLMWDYSMGGNGGSFMATPPYGENIFGGIMLGDIQGMLYKANLRGQTVQPIIDISTSWLAVGHVDEILMWVATNKVLYADPWKAADLLHQVIAAGNQTNRFWFGFDNNGTNNTVQDVVIAPTWTGYKLTTLPAPGLSNSTSCATLVFTNTIFQIDDVLRVDDEILFVTSANGPTVTVSRAQAGRSAASHSTGSVIYACSAILKKNLPVGDDSVVKKISTATNQLQQALGSYSVTFVPMPVLFDNYGGANAYLAASVDVVNCLVGGSGVVYYSETGCPVFEGYISSVLPSAQAVTGGWTALHCQEGDIHCATTARRELDLTPPWWQQVNDWE